MISRRIVSTSVSRSRHVTSLWSRSARASAIRRYLCCSDRRMISVGCAVTTSPMLRLHTARCRTSGEIRLTGGAAMLPRSSPAGDARADHVDTRGAGARGGAVRRRSRDSGSARSCARSAARTRRASRATCSPASRTRPATDTRVRLASARTRSTRSKSGCPSCRRSVSPSSSPSSRTSSRNARCGSTELSTVLIATPSTHEVVGRRYNPASNHV